MSEALGGARDCTVYCAMDKKDADGAAPRRGALIGVLALAALLSAGALWSAASLDLEMSAERFEQLVADLGPWGPLGVVVLMVAHSFVPFPAELVAFAAGAAYGVVWGAALVWIGAMLGASVAFWLARRLGRPFVERMLGERDRAALDRWSRVNGAPTLLAARFVPVIAFNLINYAAGLTRVTWWTFLWTTGLGILPLTVLMVAMGDAMKNLSWLELLGLSAIGVVVALGGFWLARKFTGAPLDREKGPD